MGLVHHTKSKGDLGVAKAYADLIHQGYLVLFPTTEHAPFDLVAYDDLAFLRVQVKYRSINRPAEHGERVTLRITPARNSQVVGVLLASLFRQLRRWARRATVRCARYRRAG